MYVVMLTYIKPLEELDRVLDEHRQFLSKYIEQNKFIVCGRKNPRIGGVIIANASSKEEIEKIVSEDPFYREKMANYEFIEVIPTKYHEGFKQFIE